MISVKWNIGGGCQTSRHHTRDDARAAARTILAEDQDTTRGVTWIAVDDGAVRLAEWRRGEGWYKGAAPQRSGWKRPAPPAPAAPRSAPYEDLPPSMVTVEQVTQSDLSGWSMSRLSLWGNRLPLVLIAALKEGADLSAYPRSKGPHTRADLDAVECYAATIQAAAALHIWIRLAAWGEAVLYPAWRERTGKTHACEERIQWLLMAAHLTPYLPDADLSSVEYHPTH
jgi:hypothetical protein